MNGVRLGRSQSMKPPSLHISKFWLAGLLGFSFATASALAAEIDVFSDPTLTEFDATLGVRVLTGSQTWSSANQYILKDRVFIKNGQTLIIDPGTKIYGSFNDNNTPLAKTDDKVGALIAMRGGRLVADGTAVAPIVFTSIRDLEVLTGIDSAADPDSLVGPAPTAADGGQWGGVVLLGNAPISVSDASGNNTGQSEIEGFLPSGTPSNDGDTLADAIEYGSDAGFPVDAADDSGVIRYVSIRHGGYQFADGKEINGLTLGGVGSGTVIDNVEVFANSDDGVEFFGGTVNTKHMVMAFNQDDSFDIDSGHTGTHQFWFSIQNPGIADAAGEWDGLEGSPSNSTTQTAGFNNGLTRSKPKVWNATFVGPGRDSTVTIEKGNFGLVMEDFVNPEVYNSVFDDFTQDLATLRDGATTFGGTPTVSGAASTPAFKGITVGRFKGGTPGTNGSYLTGVNTTPYAVFYNALGTEAPTGANVSNANTDPLFSTYTRTAASSGPLVQIDPRPAAGSPLLTSGFEAGAPAAAAYRGAFDGTTNWAAGWTALSEKGYFAGVAATPQIALEFPVGASLIDEVSTANLGSFGQTAKIVKSFTVRNTGTGTLTLSGSAPTVSGADAGKFTIGNYASTSLLPGASTTFTVTVNTSAVDTLDAVVLSVLSDDADASQQNFQVNLVAAVTAPVDLLTSSLTAFNATLGVRTMTAAATTLNAEQTYILTDRLFINNNQTVTIPAGTKIYGSFNDNGTPLAKTDDKVGALIAMRGGRLVADGTAAAPIVFTSIRDLEILTGVDSAADPDSLVGPAPTSADGGQWGGVVLLGNAPISVSDASGNNVGQSEIEGFLPSGTPSNDGDTLADAIEYGSDAGFPVDSADDSGVIRYVSIRHGGYQFADGKEINGLTLGGVGTGTIIDFVEVFANSDDGVEFFGGTVNTKHMVMAFNQDDSFDIDSGHTGTHQFWFSIQNPGIADAAGEWDGLEGSPSNSTTQTAGFNNGLTRSKPKVWNATFVGPGRDSTVTIEKGNFGLVMEDFVNPEVYNSVFDDFTQDLATLRDGATTFGGTPTVSGAASTPAFKGITVGRFKGGTPNSNATYLTGINTTPYAVFYNALGTEAPTGANVSNADTNPMFTAYTRTAASSGPLVQIDPRPAAGSPLLTSGFEAGAPIAAAYRGAFDGTTNWAAGWTALSEKSYFTGVTSTPQVSVEQPAGTTLIDGTSTLNFGSNLGTSGTVVRPFTVRNTGTATLTLAGTPTVSGTDSAQFAVAAPGDLSLDPGESTTFNVTLTLTSQASYSATLSIASDDADVSQQSFDVALVGASDFGAWAAGFPGISNTDMSLDSDGDGYTNGEEYLFGLSPTSGSSVNPITAPLDKTTGKFRYTRRKPALTGKVYTIEYSEVLTTPWTVDAAATQTVVSTSGDNETVEVTLSLPKPLTQTKLFIRPRTN